MAAATGIYFSGLSVRRRASVAAEFMPSTKRHAVATAATSTMDLAAEARIENRSSEVVKVAAQKVLEEDESERMSASDYLEQAKELVGSDGGRGPPRWFSPLECGSRRTNSPLLVYLPGIDGVGLGLITQHQKLGKIFDVWCLHVPVKDRTPFQELLLLVEETVRSENLRFPNKPIYVVGESIGACLALAVAARNPDIDLVLILANPATSYNKSQLQSLLPLLEVIPSEISLLTLPYMLSLMTVTIVS